MVPHHAVSYKRELRGHHDEPFGPAIVVPIGPEGGSGQLPGQDDLVSREMVANLKGRDMMVDRYAEIFGLTTLVPS
jgi:apoptosis-inducing factor 2